jgi:fucose permease
MLLSGVLIDTLGVQPVLIVGSLVTALAIFALTLRRSYPLTLTCILLVGLGGACISTGSVVLMPPAFRPLDRTAALNLGNVFFGLGALVTPALTDLLVRTVDFRRAMGLLAVICLVPAVLAATTPGGEFPQVEPQQGSLSFVLGSSVLWLCGLVFLLYVPLEWSVSTWATTYLTDLGQQERKAAWLLSGFWLCFLATRLLMALVRLPEGVNPWVIIVLSLLAAVAFGNLAGTSSRSTAGFGLLFLGAALGPIFPTLVAVLFREFPEKEHGSAYGAMFAVGSLGSLVLPPLVGAFARRRSVQYALRIPMVMCLLLAAAAMVLGLAV